MNDLVSVLRPVSFGSSFPALVSSVWQLLWVRWWDIHGYRPCGHGPDNGCHGDCLQVGQTEKFSWTSSYPQRYEPTHQKEPFLRASLVTSFILVYFLIFDWSNLTWLLLLLTVTDLWCVLFPSSYSSWSSSRRPSSTCPIAWLRGMSVASRFSVFFMQNLPIATI